MRRSLKASTMAKISATAPTPAAASATIPCVVVSSSIGQQRTDATCRTAVDRASWASRNERQCDALLREDGGELGSVVGRVLLARHGERLDLDRHRQPCRRRGGERDARGGGLAGGYRRNRLRDHDRLAGPGQREPYAHLLLLVLALVHHLDAEGRVRGGRELGGGTGAERLAARLDRHRAETRAVQAGRDRPAAAR